jgi:hypothetical protein
MVLMDAAVNGADLSTVMGHLSENISYGRADEDGFCATFGGPGAERPFRLTYASEYPIRGQLTLEAGQRLLFGTFFQGETHHLGGALVLSGTGIEKDWQLGMHGGKLGLDLYGARCADFIGRPVFCWVVRMPNASQGTMGNLLDGVGRGDRIGRSDYYEVIEDDILDCSLTEYAGIPNLRLLWSEVDGRLGLVIATVGRDFLPEMAQMGGIPSAAVSTVTLRAAAELVPTKYAQNFANGTIAQAGMEISATADRVLAQHLRDVKGNGNDPFAGILAGYGRRSVEAASGFGDSCDFSGLLLGEDWSFKVGPGMAKIGVAAGYVRSQTDFFGPSVSVSRKSTCNALFANLFAAYEWFDGGQLKNNFLLTVGCGNGRHKITREDAELHRYVAKFDDATISASGEWTKNLYRWRQVQFGPWLGFRYNRVTQDGYRESCAVHGSDFATMSEVVHDLLNGSFGISCEREIESMEIPGRRLLLSGKLGWQCQLLRSNSGATASIANQEYGEFEPVIGYGKRNACVINGNFRVHINPHWSFRGQWHGSFARDYTCNSVSVDVGYSF